MNRNASIVRGCIGAAAVLFMSAGVRADNYYWLVGEIDPAAKVFENKRGLATDLNNWSIALKDDGSVDPDAHPTRLPTDADVLIVRDLNFDLGGETLDFKNLSFVEGMMWPKLSYWGDDGISWRFTNGTLRVANVKGRIRTESRHGDTMTIESNATFVCTTSCDFGYGMGSDGIMPVYVLAGGTLDVSLAKYTPYNGQVNVMPGARAVFGKIGFSSSSAQKTSWISNEGGDLVFTNGIVLAYEGAKSAIAVKQSAGTMTLGGDVSTNGMAGAFTFALNGGTLKTTADVAFDCNATVAAGLVLTAETATAGTTLDVTGLKFGAGASLVKKGAGDVRVGAGVQLALAIEEGYLNLAADETVACAVTFSDGAGVRITGTNARLANAVSEGAFAVAFDRAAFNVGDYLLFTADATLRAKALASVNAQLTADAADVRATENGEGVQLIAYAQHACDVTQAEALTSAAAWGGTLPPEGADVDLYGAGTVTLTPETAALFGSIRVRDGATLRVAGGTEDARFTLPPIEIMGTAKLEVPADSHVALTGDLATQYAWDTLPIFEVATNASVYAPGVETRGTFETGTNFDYSCDSVITFKNVDMRLYGTLDTPEADNAKRSENRDAAHPMVPTRRVWLYLGTADAGETTRFAFTGIGGTIKLRNYSWYYEHAFLKICAPQVGGRVKALGPLVFKDFSLAPTTRRSYNALFAGENNPTDETFVIEADNTTFDITDSSYISGAADFRLRNGATFYPMGDAYFLTTTRFRTFDAGKITLEDTSWQMNRMAQGGNGKWFAGAFPSEEGVVALTVRRSLFLPYFWSGNGLAVGVFEDATYGVGQAILDGAAVGDGLGLYPSAPFNGLKEARLYGDNRLWSTNNAWIGLSSAKHIDWDRETILPAETAITGTGNLRIENGTPTNSFTVTLLGNANTCTGTLEAGARAKLRLADGSKWAGTVTANAGLELFATNALGEATAANVTVGTLNLTSDWALRLWKDGGSVTGDNLTVLTACTGTGRLIGAPQAGFVPQDGDVFTIGTYPAGVALPKGRGKWNVRATAIPEDENHVTLTFAYFAAPTVLIVR